ncbi:TRAP transporter substrate-binding protein [Salicibibacter cibarius]|uniref:TRAP transporter substrate-binding protein n=1 Tax=Salicibibacter cibarius TaxID=2743000 RepID=A0A7T7CB96_9BACI|nr:TRAP transporter substrate-binding protein [Salicibibacter cibarius]QQK75734.1 TRAP transporter substrate-binding protein [Salicibibacter cibarius]
MNKKSFMISVMVMAIWITGCSSSASSFDEEKEDTTTLRLGHITSEDDAWHLASIRFADLVEEKTNGSVEVELYPNSTLGGDRDLIEGMQIGSIDFALVAGVMSNFHESFAILELPYLFQDEEHLEQFLYGESGEKLQEEMLGETGVRGLEFWMRAPRQLTTNTLVEKPEDLHGEQIRVPNIEASVQGWEAMGANPISMDFGEVYSSLQTGVLDGQENPTAFATSSQIQEVQDYLVMTDHVFGYVQLTMSDQTYQKLNEDEQNAVEEAAYEAREYQNEIVFEEEEQGMQEMLDAGVEIVEIDQEPFREAVQPVHEEIADKYDRELYEEIIGLRD